MKKVSNPAPPKESFTHRRMSMIFTEWQKRYSENPDWFGNILDDDGNPVVGYGDRCAVYFKNIAKEMDAKGLFSSPKI